MTRPGALVRMLSTAAAAALTLALAVAGAAAAQTAPRKGPTTAPGTEGRVVASVSLLPRDVRPDDPHGGTWFILTLDPGGTGRAVASVTNPAPEPVEVTLGLRHLEFTEDGTPELGGTDEGIAAWGGFEVDTIEVPPHATVPAAFQVTVPSGTPPGDHIGAAVGVTRHLVDGNEVVQQIATRIVVTVPGEAARSLEITRVEFDRTSTLVPGALVGRITVRNTGSIRLAPRVTVAGQDASGSRLLTAASSETYVVEVPVSPLGGAVRLPVVVTDPSGLTRRLDESVVLVPWWLVLLLAVVAVVAVVVRRRRAGGGALADMRADVRRLERLVVDVQRRVDGLVASGLPPSPAESPAGDAVQVLEASLARARRAGEHGVFAALALALHETTGDARTVVREAAALDTPHREELARIADRLEASPPPSSSDAPTLRLP